MPTEDKKESKKTEDKKDEIRTATFRAPPTIKENKNRKTAFRAPPIIKEDQIWSSTFRAPPIIKTNKKRVIKILSPNPVNIPSPVQLYLSERKREELYQEILVYLIELRNDRIDLKSFLKSILKDGDIRKPMISDLLRRINVEQNQYNELQLNVILYTLIYATLYIPNFSKLSDALATRFKTHNNTIAKIIDESINGFYSIAELDLYNLSLDDLEGLEKSFFIYDTENGEDFSNEEEISEQPSYIEEELDEFKTIGVDETIKTIQSKVIVNNEMKTFSTNISNIREKELQALAKNKHLQLLSPIEEYMNQHTELDWLCVKCRSKFSASRKSINKNKYPCPNCREHKGGVKRKNVTDANEFSNPEVELSEILRERFRVQLNKHDISNSELGRLLKFDIKQTLNKNSEFSRYAIYRFNKRVNKLLTNYNRKTALKAIKEYGYDKGFFLDNDNIRKPESDLGYLIWYSFANELHDDTLNGYELGKELDSDINGILREKRKITFSLYLKYKSICTEKLKDKNKKLALNALKTFGRIRKYIVNKNDPNYLELKLAKALWECFTNQYKNRNMTLKEISRELYHKHILNENIRESKKFDDISLDDFKKAIEKKLSGNNLDKAIQALNDYRRERPPIQVYTEERRQKTSNSMTEKWKDQVYLEKMKSRPTVAGEDHYKWNLLTRDLIIKDILDFNNPDVKTMTQIAEKHGVSQYHVRTISKNEVEGIYPNYSHKERFPADTFSLIGQELHWIIKYIATSHFLDLGLKLYSEIIVDLMNKFAVDQLLLNIKDQKYLSERLKNNAFLSQKLFINKTDIFNAFLFDYTNDISVKNIEAKIKKYQREDMFFFIVGTRWYRRNTQDIIKAGYKNIRIIRHDLFSNLIGLKGEHLLDYEHAIELSYGADLEGLRDFHNRIKDEFILKYGITLSINRYKTGLFYNDDLKKDLESMGIIYTGFFD